MRIAVLADIHGNVRALEAVLTHVREDAPDLIVDLGDCLSGPLWPRETADLLMAQGWPTVRGNHDRALLDNPSLMNASDLHAHERIADRHRDWLRTFPLIIHRDDMALFHAQPARDDAYLMEKVTEAGDVVMASPAHGEARLRGENASLILCGHTHVQRMMQLSSGSIIVNPGSVGCPGFIDEHPVRHAVEAGSPHARYAIVTKRKDDWTIDLRAIAYDWDSASREAARNGRPEWARALATGFVR